MQAKAASAAGRRQEPLSNPRPVPHQIALWHIDSQAFFVAQLEVGLRLNGRAMSTGDAAIHTLPITKLGLGEMAGRCCFNRHLVC